MKVNLTEIVLEDIDGAIIPNCKFHKTVANLIYHSSPSLDMVDIAIALNRDEDVDLPLEQLR